MLGGRSRVRDRGNLSFGLFVCVVSSGGPRRRLVTDFCFNLGLCAGGATGGTWPRVA